MLGVDNKVDASPPLCIESNYGTTLGYAIWYAKKEVQVPQKSSCGTYASPAMEMLAPHGAAAVLFINHSPKAQLYNIRSALHPLSHCVCAFASMQWWWQDAVAPRADTWCSNDQPGQAQSDRGQLHRHGRVHPNPPNPTQPLHRPPAQCPAACCSTAPPQHSRRPAVITAVLHVAA